VCVLCVCLSVSLHASHHTSPPLFFNSKLCLGYFLSAHKTVPNFLVVNICLFLVITVVNKALVSLPVLHALNLLELNTLKWIQEFHILTSQSPFLARISVWGWMKLPVMIVDAVVGYRID
jgi:hypothetical protein